MADVRQSQSQHTTYNEENSMGASILQATVRKRFGVTYAYHAGRTLTHLAVLLPGYLDHKDYPHLTRLASALRDCGFVTASLHPFGTWDQPDADGYSLRSVLDDVDSAIANDNGLDGLPSGLPAIVLGHSFGGLAAIYAASRNPRVCAAVAIMPPEPRPDCKGWWTDDVLEQWRSTGLRTSFRYDPVRRYERTFLVPYSFVEGFQSLPPFPTIASRIHVPILLMAGEADQSCPPVAVRRLHEQLPGSTFQSLPGIDHNYRESTEAISVVNGHVMDFLARELGV